MTKMFIYALRSGLYLRNLSSSPANPLMQLRFLLFLAVLGLTALTACKPKQASTKDERMKWHSSTSLEAYQQYGEKNPKWDGEAKKALTEFAALRAGGKTDVQRATSSGVVGAYAARAMTAGCTDPLIEYLYCRFAPHSSDEELTKGYCHSADRMQGTGYAPVRKFYANFRASQMLWKDRDTNVWNQVAQYQVTAINEFTQMTQDAATPVEEIEDAGYELIEAVSNQDWALKMISDGIEKPLFQNWPNASAASLLKAQLYFYYAWRGRGNGYANKVSEEGWKLFRERLVVAAEAADKAWTLNPKNERIPLLMIKLASGQERKRDEMELWFSRAMELNTNYYEACSSKLHYLYPQWYGSQEEMLAFGRECLHSDKWGGRVPLILVDAHQQCVAYLVGKEEKAAYWKNPDVWPDLQAAFEKFFALNPDKTGWRHNYAWYAYACEQWEVLNQQIKLLGDINYQYFGGEQEFYKMVQLAKQHTDSNSSK